MGRVLRRPLAKDDILNNWDYIAELGGIEAADRWVEQLDTTLSLLATQPLMGRLRDELAPGLRSFPFGRHVVFCLPLHDGIEVVRLLHGARDIDAVFP
jgi:toxin ParE1/3/4